MFRSFSPLIIKLFLCYKNASICQEYLIIFELYCSLCTHNQLYRCRMQTAHMLFISISSYNNSLSRSLVSLCITSCYAVCLHAPRSVRLSSFCHVSDSVSVPLNLRPHPAVIRGRRISPLVFPVRGYARELNQTVIILNSVNLAPAPRQPSRPYFLNADCTDLPLRRV